MKLDAKTVSALKLGGKKDAIFFDDSLKGFGYRLRAGAGGKTLRTWIVQYRHAGCGRRYKIGPAEAFTPDEARAEAKKVLAKVWQGLDPQTARTARPAKDQRDFRRGVDDLLTASGRCAAARTLLRAYRSP